MSPACLGGFAGDRRERAVLRELSFEDACALRGHTVIAPRRPLLVARRFAIFPGGPHEAVALEPPQRRVNRAARQPGRIHDVEPMPRAARERVQNRHRRKGHCAWHDVYFYYIGSPATSTE